MVLFILERSIIATDSTGSTYSEWPNFMTAAYKGSALLMTCVTRIDTDRTIFEEASVGTTILTHLDTAEEYPTMSFAG